MRLARHIAATLKRWTRDGQDDLGRAFSPGDALILLPKRKGAFAAVVRALKDADVPVAGMDRLKLAEHIAVEDLLALANAALLPEDDLTVAVVLRSPLFGFDDDDLLRLAPGRAGPLRAALARSDAAQDRAADARLARIEDLAREVGPFAFFATVLGPWGGRKAMLARLGPEAGDAIDALLARALDHERREGPSLAGFVRAVAASDDDVRRDLASASDQVRVMTVHGAKGLEAPVVFIADIGAEPGARELGALMDVMVSAPALSNASVAVPVWTRGVQPKSPLGQARAEAVARAVEESRRLLYVAMTRAEDRLILCGVRPAKPTAFEQSWYAMVDSGLAASAAGLTPMAPLPDGLGVRRFKVTNGPPAAPRAKAEASPRPWVAALPDWALTPLPVEPVAAPPLAPSRLVAADQPPRVGDSAAASPLRRAVAARGRLVHQLLQWLPDVAPAQRPAIAARLAARGWPAAEDAVAARAQQAALVEEVMALFTDPRLADLLGPGGRSEVDLAGSLKTAQGPRPIAGRIDRLLITQAAVIFADYKTTQRPPRDAAQIPAATLAQLAAYRAVLSALYPNRPVRPWLIYTAGPTVIEPSLAQLDGALAGITGA
jgi:ATP-dependent helicase/nuclease subunit A